MKPDTSYTDNIKVVAMMPTASLKTLLDRGDEADSFVTFCVTNMQCSHVQELQKSMCEKLGKKNIMFFTAVTNIDFYERLKSFTESHVGKMLMSDVIELIAKELGIADYSTQFFAIRWPKDRRLSWLQHGLNAPRDTGLWLGNALDSFWQFSDETVQEMRKAQK